MQNLPSAAVVIGALRINLQDFSYQDKFICREVNSIDPFQLAS